MRQIIIILIYMPLLNIPLTIKAAMKRVTQKATQPITQSLLHQTRRLATTRTHRFVQLPSITKMWQRNLPTIQTRQVAADLPVNPLILYSQILTWKQQQTLETLAKYQKQLDNLTQCYQNFNNEPTKLRAHDLIKTCINIKQQIQDTETEQTKFQDQKIMLTQFYHEFTTWKQQQSIETLKLLDPFIQLYEQAYTTSMKNSFFAYGFHNMQRFFNHILHPDQSPLHIMSIIQNIEKAHHQLLELQTNLSADKKN